uniref:Uncharacterized protein n=1 Tax=Anguilla anguilla TaxID=7936 RepID=A0A0E9UJV8_ANGAN
MHIMGSQVRVRRKVVFGFCYLVCAEKTDEMFYNGEVHCCFPQMLWSYPQTPNESTCYYFEALN